MEPVHESSAIMAEVGAKVCYCRRILTQKDVFYTIFIVVTRCFKIILRLLRLTADP